MAVKSVHGTTVRTLDSGTHLYSLMADGIVLSQWRYDGRLETAKVYTRQYKGRASEVADRLVLVNGRLRCRKATAAPTSAPVPAHDKAIGPCPCGRNIADLVDGMERCEPDEFFAQFNQRA